MSSKSYVVPGEAPESDSEEEVGSSKSKPVVKPSLGKVVGGEAPESDEESNETGSLESISSALSASSIPSLTGDKTKKSSSLLAKKLRERNASLHKNLKDFVHNTISSAGNELNSTNQKLLKCQVQLQEAADILKDINSSLIHLDNNLQSLLSTPYLPHITIGNKTEEVDAPTA